MQVVKHEPKIPRQAIYAMQSLAVKTACFPNSGEYVTTLKKSWHETVQ